VGEIVSEVTGDQDLGQIAGFAGRFAFGAATLGGLLDGVSEAIDFIDGFDGVALSDGLEAMDGGGHDLGLATGDASQNLGYHPDPTRFGELSLVDGDPRINQVHGYYREDGAFVRGYWRSKLY
jgi:hypothetical protein